ncbi:MAG: adenylosuccinate lyase, partial [Bacteroidia bacterium]|nr:adenylosuccinate lyase [Bacteroidia bacterium]
MTLSSLNAISPIDGRYRKKVETLSKYFSEEALIKYRILVEIEYFISLCEIPLPQLAGISPEDLDELRAIYQTFTTEDALAIKTIEQTTN